MVGRLGRLSGSGVTVRLTGPAAIWADFNEANKAAMMRFGEGELMFMFLAARWWLGRGWFVFVPRGVKPTAHVTSRCADC